MRNLIRFVLAAFVATGLAAGAASAQDKPTKDDAKTLVTKAVDIITTKGMDEAAKIFNADGEFKYGEIYVTVIDFDGVWKIYPPRPTGVGQSVLNVKDPDGKFLVQEMIKVAKDTGEGWVEYRWLNPATNKIEPKDTYVKRIPGQDLFTFVGIYRN